MRVLFVMRHAGYVRNFEWVLRLLADRSHRVHLGFEGERDDLDLRAHPERLAEETAGAITYGRIPGRRDRLRPLAFGLRQSASFVRYLTPEYRNAARLRERWARGTPRLVVLLAGTPLLGSRAGRRAFERIVRSLERRLPRSRAVDAYLAEGGYDAVLVTPLVDRPSQLEWLRSAKALGLPTALAVASWDNLTNKGLVLEQPDRVYVWNEIQRREAVDLHHVDPGSVRVVGAHSFDHWFDWRVSTSRREFCEQVGLDPARPFLLYVCSSGFIAGYDERPFVLRWLDAVRRAEALAEIGVLIRPHPTQLSIWDEGLPGWPNAAVWPTTGTNPTDRERRTAFFDSMYHSAAVVGVNTTALIEAAIVGRRTYTVLAPELRGGQEGTLHFHYLRSENGGPLTVAASFEEHARQLGEAISRPGDDAWRTRFLESFVRPQGLDRPAAPGFVADLEQLVSPG